MPDVDTLELDADTRRVVAEMATCNDDFMPYVREFARDIDMPVEQVRRILRTLTEHGFATYGPIVDQDDGSPKGSTYWLTERGAQLQESLR